jgi:hypothetical protein
MFARSEYARSMELNYTWPEIAVMLMQRLAPGSEGVVLTRKDLAALPQEKMLVDYRDEAGTHIKFSWATINEARSLMPKVLTATGQKAGVSMLEGRYMKLACVMLWKFARDGLTLTPLDREAVPKDKTLLVSGFKDDLELRFVPRTEAARIAAWEAEQEGKNIVEAL